MSFSSMCHTLRPAPGFCSVLTRIQTHASHSPEKIAVTCGKDLIRYGELEGKSTTLAALLGSRGLTPGRHVALLCEPGISMIITLLAIHKAGGAFIPLSATHPRARILSMLDRSSCELILCDTVNQEKVAAIGVEFINIDVLDLSTTIQPSGLIFQNVPDSSAYIQFTSGSTGTPKGVNLLHRNLSYYVDWSAHFFKETVENKLPLTAAIQFAPAISQIYSCLTAGETLHILPRFQNDPEKLMTWFAEHPDYGLHCVPTVWKTLLDVIDQQKRFEATGPAALFLGGEDITEQLIEDTLHHFPDMEIWNMYGPTEGVVNLSCKRITSPLDISIGTPFAGTTFYVIKDDGREAQIGEEGQLHAAGPGIFSGYIGDAQITDTVLFDYASEHDGLVRVYNTGDYVRRIQPNEYKYLGRRDQQVKIHGQRIELAEIENRLSSHPDVLTAVVSLINGDQSCLAGYIQTRKDVIITVDALQRHLREFLTEAMIPERWIFLHGFPQLENGKIDRKSLPIPGNDRPILGYEFVAASGAREEKIVKAYQQALGIKHVGMNDSFFDLGGNSLKALTLLIEIEERFHFRPDFSTVFDYPSPDELLMHIPVLQQQDEDNGQKALLPPDKIPLTTSQQGLLFFLEAYPNSGAYTIAYALTIAGKLDINRLEKALEKIITRHLPFRAVLHNDGEGPVFSVNTTLPVQLPVELLEPVPEQQRESFVRESISNLAALPFALYDKPLRRFQIYRLNDRKHILALVVNHLVFDGESLAIFLNELTSLYQGKELAPLDGSIADMAQRRREYTQSRKFEQDYTFWQEYLEGVSGLHSLPASSSLPGVFSFHGRRVSTKIDLKLRQELSARCQQRGVTLNMLLLAAFAVTLYKFGEREEYLIASPFSNRLNKTDRSLIGYFTNTLFYRIRCNEDVSFSHLLNSVRNDTIRILDHQQMPFDQLATILRKQGITLPLSAFKTMFAYHETQDWRGDEGELSLTAREIFTRQSKCDIHLECFDNKHNIEVELTYAGDVIDEQAALQVLSVFTQVLKEVSAAFEIKISALTGLLPAEREEVIRCSVGEKIDYGKPLTLYGLFQETCRNSPDLPAISFGSQTMTYKALETKTESCIGYLLSLNLERREPVGIFLDSTPELIIAILAASALGHPYVPLDPTYPEARNQYIQGHAGIRTILTTSDIQTDVFTEQSALVFIDKIEKLPASPPCTFCEPMPEDLLYIIYTSGSTGNPKGVMVPNKGVVNYLLWMKTRFQTGTDTRILAKTSISFDISVWELFLPLISSGTLVLEKRADIESPEQTAMVIQQKDVNIFQFVPSGLKLFAEAGMFQQIPSLKKIFCGGEELPSTLRNNVLSQFQGELYNLYGPTEASIFMSCHSCRSDSTYAKVAIGRPIPNSSLYVLDKHLNLLPRNMPGYLYIGGDILATGYLRDQEKTAEAFIQSPPFLPETNLYATGDRGRMLSNGNFEFLGRKDHQIKIRGYRVELHEIEKVMEGFAGVRQAVVYKSEHSEDDVRLHALVVPLEAASLSPEEIRAGLRLKLPPYMIPATVTLTQDIPLLPNGKINQKAITTFGVPLVLDVPKKVHKMSGDNIEKVFAEIWTEVIGQNNFTRMDNFFDAGGHSLLFVKIRDKIQDRLGIDFSIVELYQYPNIATLADQYRKKHGHAAVPSAAISAIRDRIAKRIRRNHGK
jgi:amino acid adenylation domain-containing protein